MNQDVAARSLAPFAFRDAERVKTLLLEAGFTSIQIETVTVERHLAVSQEAIPKEIAANPVGADVLARGESVLASIIEEVDQALQAYKHDQGFSVSQESFLIQASAS